MAFHDADDQWQTAIDAQPDPTFTQGGTSQADLGDFLSRPIRVGTYTWAVGGAINEVIDPWTAFLTQTAVAHRINNFNLLRCKLMVKILINGTSFHYGRAIASYLPLSTHDEFDVASSSNIDIMKYSQRPHVFLDPALAQGGCLCLPFIQNRNWINVPLASDIAELGRISINSINDLMHANDGTDNVNITVFCWATDVELCMPTLSLSAQGDEFGQGIISKPAGAIAKWAGYLSAVPVIGIYAKATALAATAVGAIAHLFGFSRPNIITDTGLMKNVILGNFANCDAPDVAFKLSVDSKQELSIDPRICGLGDKDELSIQSIVERECFLTSFTWNMVAAEGALLWCANVTPKMFREPAAGGYAMTPLCFGSLPFENWSGSIVYRFQIVASSFHRGRLRFAWDPYDESVNQFEDTYNTVFTKIVDLTEERDFEVEIKWGSPLPYLEVGGTVFDTEFSDGLSLDSPSTDAHNGRLAIWTLNELVAPTDNADIEINVFVKAGPDFQLRNPSKSLQTLSYFPPVYAPQGDQFDALEAQEDINILDAQGDEVENALDGENSPEAPASAIDAVGGATYDNRMDLVCFGEAMTSFRVLLRRYNYYRTSSFWTAPVSTDDIIQADIVQKIFPLYRGHDTVGVDQDSAAVKMNFVQMTLLNYLTPAFLCRRGGIRYKSVMENLNDGVLGTMSASRHRQNDNYTNVVVGLADEARSTYENNYRFNENNTNLLPGGFTTAVTAQPGLEVEYPFYSKYRFAYARTREINNSSAYDDTYLFNRRNTIRGRRTFGTSSLSSWAMSDYVSVGEDFQLCYFVNVPILYDYNMVYTVP